MNENDLSDLVFKNKKEWGFQNKAHTCKKCTKATPASKKILVFLKKKVQKHSEQKPRIARLAEPYCSNGFHASSVQEGCVCTQF